MTRFARGGPKKRPHEASSWEELQSTGGAKSDERDPEHKPKKKKVDERTVNETNTARSETDIKRSKTVNSEKSKGKSKCTDQRTSDKQKKRSPSRLRDGDGGDKAETTKANDNRKLVEGKKKKKELSAVELAAKKDKRREERRLKRIEERHSKKVCFQCRKPGHGVADCPDLIMDVEQGMGICFRCGSTEHNSDQCRIKLKKTKGNFPFAKCFICQEMGHLSKQCPDNPRGLYPHGGGCKLFGSVEHFVRDCPEEPAPKVTEPHFGAVATAKRRPESADAEPTLSRPHKKLPMKSKGPKIVKF